MILNKDSGVIPLHT